ncbi:CC0125/CC1285 family lipoprotein [Vibrio ezurae]|uniref:Lipoprotein n=1 Tax=Vibrio ezurae NBRC 102218 TaxID=1219080 RepID=U3CLI3_9VIBR|nr:hypothetical protein [Vibrio ezurae]GAD79058.1 hypothetical protein VEZ01S_08_00940 [Vibrio ezurae NBRC 102218]
MRLCKPWWVVVLFACVLSACATPYNTQKSVWTFGQGFETTQIAPDSWQISFVGNDHTDRALLRKYVMHKAAQVCHEAGFAYFIYTNEQTTRDTVAEVGVGSKMNKRFTFNTSSTLQKGTSIVEVTGLKTKPEHASGRVYDAEFLLTHLNVD